MGMTKEELHEYRLALCRQFQEPEMVKRRNQRRIENRIEGKMYKNNKSGYNGVSMDKKGKWRAKITADGKQIYLGIFDNIQDAVKARKEAEAKYWGK